MFQPTSWITRLLFGLLLASPVGAAAMPNTEAHPTQGVLPSGPGSARGLADEASVDGFFGQVHYGIALDLPAARHGFAPPLSLLYEGSLGDGPLGMGWSLGLPRIARSLRRGVPAYDATDVLDLANLGGGGRLVPLPDGRFAVEGQGKRIQIFGDPQRGFEVEMGDGSLHLFGKHPDPSSGDKRAVWLLEKVIDQDGQEATYTYGKKLGEAYLARITWGPDNIYSLQVAYEDRADKITSYRSGERRVGSLRIKRLAVSVRGETLRTYHLTYGSQRGLSRLVQVQMTGRDGKAALPPLSLRYAGAERSKAFKLQNTENWNIGEAGTVLLDLDADGLSDMVRPESGEYKRNLGGTFAKAVATHNMPQLVPENSQIIDVDGDGKLEVIDASAAGGWSVARLQGTTWERQGIWPNTQGVYLPDAQGLSVLVDVNGDGLLDSVHGWEDGMSIALGGRSGMQQPFKVPPLTEARAQLGSGYSRWLDVNGDGLVDVLGLGDQSARLILGRGDGTFVDEGSFAYPWRGSISAPEELIFADLNRDGFVDLIYAATSGYVEWYAGLPAGGWSKQAVTAFPPVDDLGELSIGDVNGNGSLDLVWSSGWAMDVVGATHAGMLSSIDNGMGKVIRFSYEGSARLGGLAEQRDAPWAHVMSQSIPVCTQIDEFVAGSATQSIKTQVADAAWDHDEKRFAGFLRVTRRSEGVSQSDTLLEASVYHRGEGPQRVLRGKLASQSLSTPAAKAPIEQNIFTWEAQPVWAPCADPLASMPLLRQTVKRTFEATATPIETAVHYTYDAAGRPTRIAQLGRTDQSGDESILTQRFADADAYGVRDVLVEEQVEEGTGNVLSSLRHRYDGDVDPLAWGSVSRGRRRLSEQFFAEENRWVKVWGEDHDALGNATRRWVEGSDHTFNYDAEGLHLVGETLHPSPDSALHWSTEWDRISGLPLSLRDPSGGVERVAYDATGRVRALSHGDEAPHTEYVYRWGAPFSSTTTLVHDGEAGERQHLETFDGAGRPHFSAWRVGEGRWQLDAWQDYGPRGQLAWQSAPHFMAGEPVAWRRPETGGQTTYVYDALNRLRQATLPSGNTVMTHYAPLAQTVQSEQLAPTSTFFDGLGRAVRTLRQVGAVEEVATMAYDALDRPVEMRLQGGQVVQRAAYDHLGRCVQTEDSDAGPRTFSYNDAGHLLATQNGAGQTSRFVYDALGRVTERHLADASFVYHYDPSDSGPQEHASGRLSWVEEPAGSTHFTYDAQGRVAQLRRRIAGHEAHKQIVYSPSGLPLSQSTDDGFTLRYRYGPTGRLTKIDDVWEGQAFSPGGAVLRARYGNGLTCQVERDVMDRPTRSLLQRGASSLMDLRSSYTPFGALQTVRDELGAAKKHSASYTFDSAARLTHASVAEFEFDYAYDPLQNMVQRTYEGPKVLPLKAGAYVYGDPSHPRQLTAIGATTYAYDAAGRQTRTAQTQMAYDAADRLTSVRLPNGRQVTHGYGFDGARSHTTGPDGLHLAYFADLSEHDGVREHRIAVDGRQVAQIKVSAGGGPPSVTYIHAPLGQGATLLTSASGAVVEARLFEPFGAAIEAEFAPLPQSSAGKHRDATTGLSDHGARWVDPGTGQWLSTDPPAQGPSGEAMMAPWDRHPYQYARQNPLLFHDPDGHLSVLAQVGVGLALGGNGGSALEIGLQLYAGEGLNPRAIASAGLSGAANGAVAGLTFGSSLLSQSLSSAASGVAGGTVSRSVAGESTTGPHLLKDAALGVVFAGFSRAAPKLMDVVFGPRAQHVEKRLYRYMSEAEARAVMETGKLRGGWGGGTHWTDSMFRSRRRAQQRTSLRDLPEVRMEFKLKNNPRLQKNGTRIKSDYGQPGRGREYMSTRQVEVEVINVQYLSK